MRANPLQSSPLRRLAAVGALLTALLFGLSACSPRPPVGSSGAAGPGQATAGASATAATAHPAPTAGQSSKQGAGRSTPGGAQTAAQPNAAAGGAAKGGSGTGAAGSSAGASSPAYVNFVTGRVTALKPPPKGSAHSAAPQRVRVADPVSAGEVITTQKGSAAEVRVGDLFDIGLGEGASVRFDTIGASSGSSSEHRLVLTLERGALQMKAGADLVSGGSLPASAPVLLEVHTPHLFVSSRGGSLLVTEEIDSTLCAVGRGRAWVLPESVVYPNLVKTVENPKALRLLDTILSRAVSVSKHEQVTVPAAHLEAVGRIGSEVRAILEKTKGERSYAPSVDSRFAGLVGKAAEEVASAIGKPSKLTKALIAELDPQSVHHQKMKTVSSTETGPSTKSAAASPAAAKQSTSPASQPDVAHTPGYGAGAQSGQTAQTGSTTPSNAPASTTGGSSTGSAVGGSGAGGFAGPTPPTPPTPPVPPK